MRQLGVLLLIAVAAGGGCDGAEAEAPATTTSSVEPALLDSLALLAVGAPPNAEERRAWGAVSLDKAIDAMVKDPRFSRVVAPRVLLHQLFTRSSASGELLRSLAGFNAGEKVVLYLDERCDPQTAVEVAPWWAPDTKVWICPDAYRPEVLGNEQGWLCSGSNLTSYFDTCGCGPALVFCGLGRNLRQTLKNSLRNEVAMTVAHVVEAEDPIETIYTTNASHRDGMADFFYQRGRLLAGEIKALPDPREFPEGGKWAPRPESWPGQHAGVLTTHHYLHISDAARDRMRDTFAEMYCVETASVNVNTDDIRKLGVTNLREGDGWKKLAAMPVCTDCHARLDYGMQFFEGFPSTYRATHEIPSEFKGGKGPFYVDDIDDERGTADLTAHGFAAIAVAQPEFDACVVRNVARHVFAFDDSTDDRTAIAAALGKRRSLRDLMRVALQRYAERWRRNAGTKPALAGGGSTNGPSDLASANAVTIPQAARAIIDERCGDCHGSDDQLALVGAEAERSTLMRALDELASLRMPKFPGSLGPHERRSLIAAFIEALYPAQEDREHARWYWLSHQTIPPLRPFAVVSVLQRVLAMDEIAVSPGDFEEGDLPADISQTSPGFLTLIATKALAACRATGATGEALRTCLTRATDIKKYLNDVPPM